MVDSFEQATKGELGWMFRLWFCAEGAMVMEYMMDGCCWVM